MAERSSNGNGVTLTRATIALIVAITTPVAGGAVMAYRVGQAEELVRETRLEATAREARIRKVEEAVIGLSRNEKQLDELSYEVRRLREEVEKLAREDAKHHSR